MKQDLEKSGILFLMPRHLYRGWPICNDFTRHLVSSPSCVFPQLAAMIPEFPSRIADCGYGRRTTFSEYLELLKRHPVIGISVESPLVALNAELTLGLIRKHNPTAKVILGGHHATFYAREWLERGVDVVVRREGEITFPSVVRRFATGGPIDDIAGISYRRDDGTAVHNEDAAFVENLDDLPLPEWKLVDLSVYRYRLKPGGPPATIEAARGCPHQCRFCCAAAMWNNRQRFKSSRRILEEMDRLVSLGVGQVLFADDNFAARRDRDSEVFEGVLSRGWDLGFWAFVRADTVLFNPDFFRLAARAGLRQVFIGYESIGDDTLDYYRKNLGRGITAADYKTVYRLLHENGIFVTGLFVRDFDSELESRIRLRDWFNITKISEITAQTRFIPMRGVPGAEDLVAHGFEVKDMFYHDRFIPAFSKAGLEQSSNYLLVALYDLFKPRNFIRMLFGTFVERRFFRTLYKAMISDITAGGLLNIRAFFMAVRSKPGPDARQENIVAMFKRAYGLAAR